MKATERYCLYTGPVADLAKVGRWGIGDWFWTEDTHVFYQYTATGWIASVTGPIAHLYGSTAANGDLTIESTSSATFMSGAEKFCIVLPKSVVHAHAQCGQKGSVILTGMHLNVVD